MLASVLLAVSKKMVWCTCLEIQVEAHTADKSFDIDCVTIRCSLDLCL